MSTGFVQRNITLGNIPCRVFALPVSASLREDKRRGAPVTGGKKRAFTVFLFT
jgi:hypothetical protein